MPLTQIRFVYDSDAGSDPTSPPRSSPLLPLAAKHEKIPAYCHENATHFSYSAISDAIGINRNRNLARRNLRNWAARFNCKNRIRIRTCRVFWTNNVNGRRRGYGRCVIMHVSNSCGNGEAELKLIGRPARHKRKRNRGLFSVFFFWYEN